MRRLHGPSWFHGIIAAALFGMWPVAWKLGWVMSVVFISHISIANFAYTALDAWQSARAAKKAEESRDSSS